MISGVGVSLCGPQSYVERTFAAPSTQRIRLSANLSNTYCLHSTIGNERLRNCPQLSATLLQQVRRNVSKSWLVKSPYATYVKRLFRRAIDSAHSASPARPQGLIYTYTCIYIYIYIHSCVYIYICIYIYIYTTEYNIM